MRARIGLPLAVLLAMPPVAVGSSSAMVQATDVQNPCDPTLLRPPTDPLSYSRRGERCEGVYFREVAGSAGLTVASFTEQFELLELTAGERLHVDWSTPQPLPVKLRAMALRPRLYYRMDALRPAGSTGFDWPAEVLASLKLRGQELGVVGWVEQRVGDQDEDVYVPIRIGKTNQPIARTGRYLILLVPGATLSEVFVSLSEVGSDGHDVATLKRDEPLGYGLYPAGRAIRITLPSLDRRGLYRVLVGATLSRGGSATKRLLFHHSR